MLNHVFKGKTVTDRDSTRRANCLCRPNCLVLILNSKQSYHISIVTVLLHIVTTIRIFIKSPEEGRLDCPKYRENQVIIVYFRSPRANVKSLFSFCFSSSGGYEKINAREESNSVVLSIAAYRS